jgi:Uma2 family endonuclease
MSMATKRLTYEEWLALPEMKQRYEIVDGVMFMPPSPTYLHQRALRRIARRLEDFVEENHLGEILTAPLDLLIQREPLRTRQPDISYLDSQQAPGETQEDVIDIRFLEVAPTLLVEMLSPSNTRPDLDSRPRDYQQIGVRECWLFDPASRTMEITDLSNDEPESVVVFGVEETLRSDLLPGFALSLREVFR